MIVFRDKKVSVVIPNYNYAKYIKRRILSVSRQTYPIYEIIVLDDASTDDSKRIIENAILDIKIMNPELKIKFVENKKNSGGAIKQWKKGFELAKGDFVWIAEADDLCSRNFLTEVMKGFDDPDVVLSYAESAIMNSAGIVIAPNFRWSRDREKTGHFKNSYVKDGRREIAEIMAVRCTVPNVSAAVFRKTPELLEYLKLAEKFKQVGDWFLYTKLLENGKISYNRKSLNLFRIHRNSATKRGNEHVRELEEMHKYFNDNYNLEEDVKERMRIELERVRHKYNI